MTIQKEQGSEELKPCPWCTDNLFEHVLIRNKGPDGVWYIQAACCKCGAFGPERSTETEAIQAWNTRPGSSSNNAADFSKEILKPYFDLLRRAELNMQQRTALEGLERRCADVAASDTPQPGEAREVDGWAVYDGNGCLSRHGSVIEKDVITAHAIYNDHKTASLFVGDYEFSRGWTVRAVSIVPVEGRQ